MQRFKKPASWDGSDHIQTLITNSEIVPLIYLYVCKLFPSTRILLPAERMVEIVRDFGGLYLRVNILEPTKYFTYMTPVGYSTYFYDYPMATTMELLEYLVDRIEEAAQV